MLRKTKSECTENFLMSRSKNKRRRRQKENDATEDVNGYVEPKQIGCSYRLRKRVYAHQERKKGQNIVLACNLARNVIK